MKLRIKIPIDRYTGTRLLRRSKCVSFPCYSLKGNVLDKRMLVVEILNFSGYTNRDLRDSFPDPHNPGGGVSTNPTSL